MTTAAQTFSSAAEAQTAASTLGGTLVVKEKRTTTVDEAAPPPYTTLTLLEDTAAGLGWDGQKTMAAAQRLFEGGYLTYPRTDATHVAPAATEAARAVIVQRYGAAALPSVSTVARWLRRAPAPGAPEEEGEAAHEALRPTDPAHVPADVRLELPPEGAALYELIWQRFLASFMRPARIRVTTVTLAPARRSR